MNKVISSRADPSSLLNRERLREILLYIVIVILLGVIMFLGALSIAQNDELNRKEAGIYRTTEELMEGGKRFIDYFYSLNASTFHHDQFRATQMFVNEEDSDRRWKEINTKDLVRAIRETGMKSRIDWNRSSVKLIKKVGNNVVAEYDCLIVIDSSEYQHINMILTLTPVVKSDENRDGIGVVEFRDVAIEPFEAKQSIENQQKGNIE